MPPTATVTPTRSTQRRGTNTNGNNQGNRTRSPKRVRIEEPDAYNSATGAGTNTQKAKPKTSPTAAAKEALEKATKSHHEAITTIGLPHALKVQTFRHQAYAKKNAIKKMEEEDDFIPHSVRIKPKLVFAEETLKGMDPQRKKNLEDAAHAEVVNFQQRYKKIVIEAAKEDLAAFRNRMVETTVELLYQVTDTFITAEGITTTTVQTLSYNAIFNYGKHLFEYFHQDPALIVQRFVDKYSIDTDTGIEIPNLLDDQGNDLTGEALRDAVVEKEEALEDPRLRQIEQLVHTLGDYLREPAEAYYEQLEANKIQLELKRKLTELRDSMATQATAMDIDQEAPVDRRTLSALIHQEVHKATEPLKRELTKLKKKNSASPPKDTNQNPTQRGRVMPGASNKKKSGKQNTNQNSRPRSRSRGSSVGSRNSGTGGGKKKKQQPKKQQQQRKKNGNSNGRSNKRNGNSNTRNTRS